MYFQGLQTTDYVQRSVPEGDNRDFCHSQSKHRQEELVKDHNIQFSYFTPRKTVILRKWLFQSNFGFLRKTKSGKMSPRM